MEPNDKEVYGIFLRKIERTFEWGRIPLDAYIYLTVNRGEIERLLVQSLLAPIRFYRLPFLPEKFLANKEQEKELVELLKYYFPFGKIPLQRLQRLHDHPKEISWLINGMFNRLVKWSKVKEEESSPERPQIVKSEWQALFGYQRSDPGFTEENFPLGEGGGNAVEFRWRSNVTVTGREALACLASNGYRPSPLRSVGNYLQKYPIAQRHNSLVALGAQWKKGDNVLMPVFTWDAGPAVNLCRMETGFSSSGCCFLVERKN